jgi:hypothetical protein
MRVLCSIGSEESFIYNRSYCSWYNLLFSFFKVKALFPLLVYINQLYRVQVVPYTNFLEISRNETPGLPATLRIRRTSNCSEKLK